MTKNNLIIFDSSFSKEIFSINKEKDFNDYCLFSDNGLALKKNGLISINKFGNNLLTKEREISLKSYGINIPFIGTNEYLIIGGIEQLIFINIIDSFKIETKLFNVDNKIDNNEKIIFMTKIHNYFILASTTYGKIIQINIGEKGAITIVSKFIKNMPIFCVLMIDYESLLISGDNGIDILSIIQKKEKKYDKNCMII